jgi:hypothetical protein
MAARVRERQLIDDILRPNPTTPYFLQIFIVTSCVVSRDKLFLRLTLITVPTLSRLLFQQALDQVLYGLCTASDILFNLINLCFARIFKFHSARNPGMRRSLRWLDITDSAPFLPLSSIKYAWYVLPPPQSLQKRGYQLAARIFTPSFPISLPLHKTQ